MPGPASEPPPRSGSSARPAEDAGPSSSSSPPTKKQDYAAAGAARVEAIQSCVHEKALYDACWNHWYRYHFIRGQLQQNCNHFFEEYRACVLEEIERKSLGEIAAAPFSLTSWKENSKDA
ncbi:family UPF0203 protein [Toxoplasma gondii ARI]|uniref:Family UPF0203 protein n=4 Tax=Toxoplasma gondii TaxID=5811 RepID=A0A2G8XX69_TOXGO|nr:family UPF0203 protein [Toxoplasma gondii MAS]KYF44269.1 family UPF0203 protein [Toxoplasma gondii ARI]PIL99624.1 family UPF0203 protein [Toxoplasma gondii COUG]PUA89365.1 family UPF0203 protein [Toxoplasma gondii TgCATBr9]